jgi:hypothetical protein
MFISGKAFSDRSGLGYTNLVQGSFHLMQAATKG